MARNLMELKKRSVSWLIIRGFVFLFYRKLVYQVINSTTEGSTSPLHPSLGYMNMFSNCEQYLIHLGFRELLESCLNENVINSQYSQRQRKEDYVLFLPEVLSGLSFAYLPPKGVIQLRYFVASLILTSFWYKNF